MIDPQEVAESISEDLVVDVLSDIETDLPHLSGALPSNSMALEISKRIVYAVLSDLGDHTGPLGYCHCLTPIHQEQLEQGYCNVCGKTIALRIRREVA